MSLKQSSDIFPLILIDTHSIKQDFAAFERFEIVLGRFGDGGGEAVPAVELSMATLAKNFL